MMNQPDLGKKIAELRKSRGLTQEELVEKKYSTFETTLKNICTFAYQSFSMKKE